jgi:hypothetical protein
LDRNIIDGYRALGAPPDVIAQLEEQLSEQERADEEARSTCYIHEDNWRTWLFYLSVETQWIYRGLDGRRAGLNTAAIEASARMQGILRPRRQRELLNDLRIIEAAVLEADAKHRQQQE